MSYVYLCIDLKTFYASVECVERGLDPFTTNLVVADSSRGKGTICLAITPKMKMLGVKNRCRVYQIPPGIKYIVAEPRMNKYIEYSANIYEIYLKYVSKEDIHVYSVDEAFLDITHYLHLYNKTPLEMAKMIIGDIYDTYGLTATAGIGTNLYLAKIALDIVAKHSPSNIGFLNEKLYQEKLWHHKPLSDFWQIGRGIENRLRRMYIFDMYDIAHTDEKRLYKQFGINAELLIDHAWGRENCTIADIKKYKPKSNSVSNTQVLFEDYPFEKARVVLKEMVENGSLTLTQKKLVTDTIYLYVGYSKDQRGATGGRRKLEKFTNSYQLLLECFLDLYDQTTDRNVMIRRLGVGFLDVGEEEFIQMNMFYDVEKEERERKLEETINLIKVQNGKNSILRGMNFEEGATAKLRNTLVGGHKG